MSKRPIDTERFSHAMRQRGIEPSTRRVLVTRYDGSDQANDFTVPPNCEGWGRVHHFRRTQGESWPDNPLPIDPAARWLGVDQSDMARAQVFQNAICNWRCWYCFVDFELLSANREHADFKSASELLDLYLAQPDRPGLVDLSGGQPDLVPEWALWFSDEVARRGLEPDIYIWSDDNLSNDYLWRFLTEVEIARLARRPNHGRVGCFKGFDDHSFGFNTAADPTLFSMQFKVMSRLVEAGFDVYGYVTLTSDDGRRVAKKMRDFVDRLQSEVHELFPLRTVPLRIRRFTPTQARINDARDKAFGVQNEAVQAWVEEIERRYPVAVRRMPIFSHSVTTK